MLEAMVGQKVVIDLRGPFVCIGKLASCSDAFFEVQDADFHDMRDTQTTRENYIVASKRTGIKQNRRSILVMRSEVVAMSRFKDVIDD